jgi:predicted dehydrogenase
MTHQNSCITTIHSHFNIPDNAARSTLDIYGTKGSIRASGTLGQIDEGDVLFLYENSQKELIYEPVNMYTEEIEAFGDSILKGKEIIVPAFDAIHAQIVTEALYLSSKNGKRVDIKEEREYK